MIRAQPCPLDTPCFLIHGMRNHRKCVHIQPDTRTVETHRRPPDLQLWLYRSECSPATGNPRPIAARGLRPQVASIPSRTPGGERSGRPRTPRVERSPGVCKGRLLYQSTHPIRAYSTSWSATDRIGIGLTTASVLNNPMVVSASALP